MKRIILMATATVLFWGMTSCSSEDEVTYRPESVKRMLLTGRDMEIKDCCNRFSFALLREMTMSSDENVTQVDGIGYNDVFSPMSIANSLGMYAMGSNGETRAEILDVLGLEDGEFEALGDYFMKLNNQLTSVDPMAKIEIVNYMKVFDPTIVEADYIENIRKYFAADLRGMNAGPNSSLGGTLYGEWLRNWQPGVSIGPCPVEYTDMIPTSVNTISFDAPWSKGFSFDKKSKEKFYNDNGTTTAVEMMTAEHESEAVEIDDAYVLTLPFANDAFKISFMMPKEGVTVNDFLDRFDLNEWYEITSYFIGHRASTLKLVVPKFDDKASYTVRLEEALKRMGVKALFDKQSGDFGPLTQTAVDMTVHFSHDASFEMSETGVKAKASTNSPGGIISPGPYPYSEFVLDHPFVYVIYESNSGAILFMGRVNRF